MTRDTSIGGPNHRFPETRRTALEGIADQDGVVRRQSYDAIVSAYWKPVYKHVRLRWNESNESAKDLTQGFFSNALERGNLANYDPAKGTFRTYLRVCVDGFVLNERKCAGRLKRSGGELPLNFEPATDDHIEEAFQREWIRSVFTLAVDDLRSRQDPRFRAFELYDLNEAARRPSYAEIAEELGVSTPAVTNYLAAMRREFRKAVLARLRELTASEREYRSEARALGLTP